MSPPIYASTEQKAMDGAAIVAERLGLSYGRDEALGENDRSSTGYIAPPEFWEVVARILRHARTRASAAGSAPSTRRRAS